MNQPDDRTSERPAAAGCGSAGLFLAAVVWILVITFGVQYITWYVDQSLLASGMPLSGSAWQIISLVQAVLLALPIVPLAFLAAGPYRVVYRAWSLAILFTVLVSAGDAAALEAAIAAADTPAYASFRGGQQRGLGLTPRSFVRSPEFGQGKP